MTSPTNPYVGPRTFSESDRLYYFGREQEARDLTARIVSERLLLFYAQSGAGKSSLINTCIIPNLRDEEGFFVLPVGRVSGALPPGVQKVDNIFAYNLMNSLDQSSSNQQRLAGVRLDDFLARLVLVDEPSGEYEEQGGTRWVYQPKIDIERGADPRPVSAPRFALVIDQFEEIITRHPAHWREREVFFEQLNEALLNDPNLWVVLTLREDFVAALDPYAPLLLNRLRARFYMERMDEASALEAVKRPAELGGRPFAPGVAEQLVDDLLEVQIPGREETITSQYVEPVQLQVVCYQMWEKVEESGGGSEITAADLEESGDVDQALAEFYEETLRVVIADEACQDTNEDQLRRWFDRELITAAGTRGLVHQGEKKTGGLPNEVVRLLQNRFLVRTELRAGATWVELVHDRFVQPIHDSNSAWFDNNLNVLQRQALLWERQGRSSDLLLRGAKLREAETWARDQKQYLQPYEEEYLAESQRADQEAVERERNRTRLIAALAVVAVIVAAIALGLFFQARSAEAEAREQAGIAETESLIAKQAQAEALVIAKENEDLANQKSTAEADARSQADDAKREREKAEQAQATALDDRATAVAGQATMAAGRATAEALTTIAIDALATTEAKVVIELTAQALQIGPVDQAPSPTAVGTPETPGVASVPISTEAAPADFCPGALPSRLSDGDRARVATSITNVRRQAGNNSPIGYSIGRGRLIDIVGGPLCVDGQVWYEIRGVPFTNSAGDRIEARGWTSEGSAGEYFLDPQAVYENVDQLDNIRATQTRLAAQ